MSRETPKSETYTLIEQKVDYYVQYYNTDTNHNDSIKLYIMRRLFSMRELASKLDDEGIISYPEYVRLREKIEKYIIEIGKGY